MTLFYEASDALRLWCSDVPQGLTQMEPVSARCCVTSPPYWGLRDYGVPPTPWPAVEFSPMPGLSPVSVPAWSGCLGLEPEPLAFVAHLVHVFRDVRRVLADDGTLWLNLGDSYAGPAGGGQGKNSAFNMREACTNGSRKRTRSSVAGGLKPKDLIGIPWRVAFALQADGWFLRSDVVWAKPNPIPESVTDRPTKAHEYVFLLSKSGRYFYDTEAVKEAMVKGAAGSRFDTGKTGVTSGHRVQRGERASSATGRNARSVWAIATQPYHGAHFATMPPRLAERCILAGSQPGDLVIDPFNGAGTTGLASLRAGRRFAGIDLSSAFCELALNRWREEFSLFLPSRTAKEKR